MRLCLLTTDTLHHSYFAQAISAAGCDVLALVETGAVAAPYETAHPFEDRRDAYERETWFGGRTARIADLCETRTFENINAAESVAAFRAFAPDLAVTFGTRRLGADMIAAGGDRLTNLHGGDPARYRGLDSHLWAVWHGDFSALSTCLHLVDTGLDTGAVIAALPVDLQPGMALHQLRRANTEVCVKLAERAVERVERAGDLPARPQAAKGRYYSFMPTVLKEICVDRFARHTEGLE